MPNGEPSTGFGGPKSYRSEATSPTISSRDGGSSTTSSIATELEEATTVSKEIPCIITDSSACESPGFMDAYEQSELSRLRLERRKKSLKLEKQQQLKEAKKKSHSEQHQPEEDRDTSHSPLKKVAANRSRSSSMVTPPFPDGDGNDNPQQEQSPDTGIEVDEAIQVGFAVLRALKVASGGAEETGPKEYLLNHLHSIISPDETLDDEVQGHSSVQLEPSGNAMRTNLRTMLNSNISKPKAASSRSLAALDSAPAKPKRTNSNDDLVLVFPKKKSTRKSSPPESTNRREGSNHTWGATSLPSLVDIESESVGSSQYTEKKKASNWMKILNALPPSRKQLSRMGSSRQSKRSEEDPSPREKPQSKNSGSSSQSSKDDPRQQTKKKSISREPSFNGNAHSSMMSPHTKTGPRPPRPQVLKAQSERNLDSMYEKSRRSENSLRRTTVSEDEDNAAVYHASPKQESQDRKLTSTVRKGKRPVNLETSISTLNSITSQSEHTPRTSFGRKSSVTSHSNRSRTPSTSNRSAAPTTGHTRTSSRSSTSNGTRSEGSPKRSRSAGPSDSSRRDRSKTPVSKRSSTCDDKRDRSTTPTRTRSTSRRDVQRDRSTTPTSKRSASTRDVKRDRSTTPTSKRSASTRDFKRDRSTTPTGKRSISTRDVKRDRSTTPKGQRSISTRDGKRDRSTTPTGTRSANTSNGRERSRTPRRRADTSATLSGSSASGSTRKPKSQANNPTASEGTDPSPVDVCDRVTETPGRWRLPSKQMKLWLSLRSFSDSTENLEDSIATYTHLSLPTRRRHQSLERLARSNLLPPGKRVSEPVSLSPPSSDVVASSQAQLKSPAKQMSSRKDTRKYYRDGSDSKQPVPYRMQESSKSMHQPFSGHASVDAFLSNLDWQNKSFHNSTRSLSLQVKKSSMKKTTAR